MIKKFFKKVYDLSKDYNDIFLPSSLKIANKSQKLFSGASEEANNLFDGKKISEPYTGSIVYCDLGYWWEHSGIYVGYNSIIHLNGNGIIEQVTPKEFVSRLNGFNSKTRIYVSCNDYGSPVYSYSASSNARSMLGKKWDYKLHKKNCHTFAYACLTGNFTNSTITMSKLKSEARKIIGATDWLPWNINLF